MSKKSILVRELKRNILVNKYALKRKKFLMQLKNVTTLEEIYNISKKIQKLPRNSSKIRIRNRCWKTGKSRSYFRFFGLCRNILRNFAHNCVLPGIIKASW